MTVVMLQKPPLENAASVLTAAKLKQGDLATLQFCICLYQFSKLPFSGIIHNITEH
jgi:hypothetical protein